MNRRSRGATIEVLLTRGEAPAHVLRVAHIARGERFTLGEGAGCDALVPVSSLGALRCAIVDWRGVPRVVPPAGAHVEVDGVTVVAPGCR